MVRVSSGARIEGTRAAARSTANMVNPGFTSLFGSDITFAVFG